VLNAFSAHADKKELLEWASVCAKQARMVFCIHETRTSARPCRPPAGARHQAAVPALNETADLDY